MKLKRNEDPFKFADVLGFELLVLITDCLASLCYIHLVPTRIRLQAKLSSTQM